ncbi:hypothetical protein [Sulfurimonas sp. HSL-1716]|uniref:hypothetical protein n=1 Tax=Hydrocurvibacter sulfurireducens TaxID=3131937 RepID=UPI0031F7C8C4
MIYNKTFMRGLFLVLGGIFALVYFYPKNSDENKILSFSQKQICEYATDNCYAILQINTKKRSLKIEKYFGPFFLSRKNNQILDCGGYMSHSGEYAHIINYDGSAVSIKHLGDIMDCSLTKDGSLYWFYYYDENGALITVYDKNAKLVKEIKPHDEDVVHFDYNATDQIIKLNPPY